VTALARSALVRGRWLGVLLSMLLGMLPWLAAPALISRFLATDGRILSYG